MPDSKERELNVVSLYPRDMNIYGDSGNVLVIRRRCELHGYTPRIINYNQGDQWPEHVDMVLGGGGQDAGQRKIGDDLTRRADVLRTLAEGDTPMLMVCGLYQLFGNYFQTVDGDRIAGIGVFDAYTVAGTKRLIGNVQAHSDEFGQLVGYENHSGQTFLQDGTQPLASVREPAGGNNGQDRTEGARIHHVIGTYLHGSLLPKNPAVADFLIRHAAISHYGSFEPESNAEAAKELERLDHLAEQARLVAAGRPR